MWRWLRSSSLRASVYLARPARLQDPENEVREMGDALLDVFEQKYAEFLRQEKEQQVRGTARPTSHHHLMSWNSTRVVVLLAVCVGRRWRPAGSSVHLRMAHNSLSSGRVCKLPVRNSAQPSLPCFPCACWACVVSSYTEATWEPANELEDEVIAEFYSRNRPPAVTPPPIKTYPASYRPVRASGCFAVSGFCSSGA